MTAKKIPQVTTSDVAPDIKTEINAPSNLHNSEIERPDLAVATDTDLDDPVTRGYVEDLAFMEDIVTFRVGQTKDKNDPNPIIAGVNGVMKVIQLGREYKLPRKFINVMINRVMDVTTHEYTDQDGLKQTRIQTVSTPSLQIQIIHDPNPKGMAWFAREQYGNV